MEYLILIVGSVLLILGMIGSFLPVIPGPPLSWLGLLSVYLVPATPYDYWLLGISFSIMLFISIADYFIPGYYSTKRGGSKYASWGATLGLVLGLIFFPPLGLLFGAFVGAFLGEFIFNRKATSQQALNSAFGAFIGFLVSALMKFFVCLCFLMIFIYKVWEFKTFIF